MFELFYALHKNDALGIINELQPLHDKLVSVFNTVTIIQIYLKQENLRSSLFIQQYIVY